MRVGRRIRLKCAACGRGNFLNPERKVADTEISGYVRTGPCADFYQSVDFFFTGRAL